MRGGDGDAAQAPRQALIVVTIERLQRAHIQPVAALLDDLRVSLFGTSSHRLHCALARDAAAGAIDGRVAVDAGEVCGVVLAAPASYWRSALLTHWAVAFECLLARLSRAAKDRSHHSRASARTPGGTPRPVRPLRSPRGLPSLTWAEPGDAWRIVIVGTSETARGKGIGSRLYRSVMSDRSLVARIASDNAASIRLHESLGWQIYPDGPVLLAVHDRRRVRPYSADAAAAG